MVGGSIVVLFKWCSIVIALYIMRTFSPNSGSVFCGFLVFFLLSFCFFFLQFKKYTSCFLNLLVVCGFVVCLVLSCCVCCLQLNESSCSCLNCLVVCWLYLTNCL